MFTQYGQQLTFATGLGCATGYARHRPVKEKYYDFERDIFEITGQVRVPGASMTSSTDTITLSEQLLELEYSFRSLGSGGPGSYASKDVRRYLKSISILYNKDYQSTCHSKPMQGTLIMLSV
jgi:hypothetical protein